MRDSELRGMILERLYNQRHRELVDFETELGDMSLPDGAMQSIVRQLEKKGLIERPSRPKKGLAQGRITTYGVDVVEQTRSPPMSILLKQPVAVQIPSDVQSRTHNTQNTDGLNQVAIAAHHSKTTQNTDKSLTWTRKLIGMLNKFTRKV
jgi:hypothetical protein